MISLSKVIGRIANARFFPLRTCTYNLLITDQIWQISFNLFLWLLTLKQRLPIPYFCLRVGISYTTMSCWAFCSFSLSLMDSNEYSGKSERRTHICKQNFGLFVVKSSLVNVPVVTKVSTQIWQNSLTFSWNYHKIKSPKICCLQFSCHLLCMFSAFIYTNTITWRSFSKFGLFRKDQKVLTCRFL